MRRRTAWIAVVVVCMGNLLAHARYTPEPPLPAGPRQSEITLLGTVPLPGQPQGVAVDALNRYAYVAAGAAGLQIVDACDPVAPKVMTSRPGSDDHRRMLTDARGVALHGRHVLVASGGDGVASLEVDSPAQPSVLTLRGSPFKLSPNGEAFRVAAHENLVFVAGGQNGFSTLHLTQGALSEAKIGFPVPDARGVSVTTTLTPPKIYAVVAEGALRVIDVSNPGAPEDVGRSVNQPNAWMHDVALSKSIAFAAQARSGIAIFDLSEPSKPEYRGSMPLTSGDTWAVEVGDERLVAAEGTGGVRAFDVADSLSPKFMGHATVPVDAHDVAIANGLAFVADQGTTPGTGQLLIFDLETGASTAACQRPPSSTTPSPSLTASPSATPTGTPTSPPTPTPSATPTATATSTPGPSPTPTPTSTPVPPCSPSGLSRGAGISGSITFQGQPLRGTNVHLDFEDNGSVVRRESQKTDGLGRFHFAQLSPLSDEQRYSVKWENDNLDTSRLLRWVSRSLEYRRPDEVITLCGIEISAVPLDVPHLSTIPLLLPVEFEWRRRIAGMFDTYRLQLQSETRSDPPTWTSGDLQQQVRFTLDSLPPAFQFDTPYCWAIEVKSTDGGTGVPLECRSISFTRHPTPPGASTASVTPTPTNTATAYATAPPTHTVAPPPTLTPFADGLHGRVFLRGTPATGETLVLSHISRVSGVIQRWTDQTDSDGVFEFTGLPSLRSGEEHYVIRWENIARDPAKLLYWSSDRVEAYNQGDRKSFRAFDIANVKLREPNSIEPTHPPIAFRWDVRGTPGDDNYTLELSPLQSTSDPPYAIQDLGRTGQHVVSGRPSSVTAGTLYGWTILIQNDGGRGRALSSLHVMFAESAPTAEPPTPDLRATPTLENIRDVMTLPLAVRAAAPKRLSGFEFTPEPLVVMRGRYDERPTPSTIMGPATSGIQIQSLDASSSAEVITSFTPQYDVWDREGIGERNFRRHSLKSELDPFGAINIWMGNALAEPPFQGDAYSVNALSFARLAAIVRTDWQRTGGTAIYSNARPSRRVIVPLVMREFNGQTSVVTIADHSLGDQWNAVAIRLFERDKAGVFGKRQDEFGIRPGHSITIDLGDFYYTASRRLPDRFVGSMEIASGGAPITVQSFVNNEGVTSKAVSGFEGIPIDDAARTLFAPLIRHRQSGGGSHRLDTGISVYNPGDRPVHVTVSYTGSGDYCKDMKLIHGRGPGNRAKIVQPRSSTLFFQGPGPEGDHELPEDCFGSAVIQAEEDFAAIMAVVQDIQDMGDLAAAYQAVPASRAARRVALPLIRRDHLRLTTGIMVMNVSQYPATVTADFYDKDQKLILCDVGCDKQIAPNAADRFWPDEITAIPRGTYGSAIVRSNQPIVVIVNDYPLDAQADMAAYNGIPIDP